MKRIVCTALIAASVMFAEAQQTRFINDPEATLKLAKEYYQKESYSLAYPLFKELNLSLKDADRSNQSLNYQEIKYYTLVCALKQNEDGAVGPAMQYIDLDDNVARVEMMSFHLGEYYFRQRDFNKSVEYFEKTKVEHLNNREIADMKFHQGYGYFNLQQFDKAKPMFDAVRQLSKDPNYIDANYYYGFLAFKDKQFNEALNSFKIVENEPNYEKVVPFYIATIYYYKGEKDKAIEYAESKIKKGGQFYDLEMRQLAGHYYFEKKQYDKALPYLESYIEKSKKVRREDLYELSYVYYQSGSYTKAIDGFKQLGGEQDSLGQNSMYLLADAYLKTNQKANARNAFLFCASNSSNPAQKEISRFNYAKLSYELGYQDIALTEFRKFLTDYPNSTYVAESKELLIGVMANTNNYKDGLTLLESVPNPSDNVKRLYPRVAYGRATELINDGMLIGANDLLDKVLKAPYNEQVLPFVNFWKGEISFRLYKIDDAIRYYFEYLKTPVTSGEVNPTNAKYNLGYCFLKKENYKQAQTYFEQVASTSPRINASAFEQDAYLRIADCYYMNRDFKKSMSMYDKVIGYSWPASDYATFQKAMVAGVSSGAEKVKLLQTIPRVYPTSSLIADANMEIANSYLSDEKFTQSIPFLKNVANNTVNEALKPKAYLKLGIAYYNANNNKEALNQYNTLLTQYPNSPEAEEAFDNAKTIYVEEGRTSEYISYAKSVGKDVSTSQEDSLTYAEAEVQFSNGNFNAALGKFDTYITRFPEGKYTVDAYYYRSEIYFNRKDWAKAAAGYAEVGDRAPNRFGEKSLLTASRLYFFDLKNYTESEKYFSRLKEFASSQENKLEAMRGLLRSQFELKKWAEASDNAKDLLQQKGLSTDDKVLANMTLAKSAQTNNQCDLAISYFKAAAAINKAAYGAEARYEISNCLFQQGKMKEAEKAAFETIDKSGSYGLWITKSYILLGDIYVKEKDYFNAKATFQSVVANASLPELKEEAQRKLDQVTEEEKKVSKIGG